ncbi:hypothetical protein CB0940_11031 [Lecanosticta acicola]|uniref:F-box domain-containing protein n=1 Tax=Lecanosticta acicola TaxID=111012 RepID=A0AAI8Z0B3_9PEZI|nr:hypothetical protein CB0940_11031 [Lecanosticta acicola]
MSAHAQQQREESAYEKVFRVSELAEAVLLELPPRQVLRNQIVCRQWKEVIKGSIPLQEALFFRPLTITPPVHYESEHDHWAISEAPRSRVIVFQFPLLDSNLRGSLLSQSSWRRQLVTQPPLEKCKVIHSTLTHYEEKNLSAPEEGGGVRAGQISELETSEWHRGGLSIDGWRTWRTCSDNWRMLPAREFLGLLIQEIKGED